MSGAFLIVGAILKGAFDAYNSKNESEDRREEAATNREHELQMIQDKYKMQNWLTIEEEKREELKQKKEDADFVWGVRQAIQTRRRRRVTASQAEKDSRGQALTQSQAVPQAPAQPAQQPVGQQPIIGAAQRTVAKPTPQQVAPQQAAPQPVMQQPQSPSVIGSEPQPTNNLTPKSILERSMQR